MVLHAETNQGANSGILHRTANTTATKAILGAFPNAQTQQISNHHRVPNPFGQANPRQQAFPKLSHGRVVAVPQGVE
jgi:hypothetical protein